MGNPPFEKLCFYETISYKSAILVNIYVKLEKFRYRINIMIESAASLTAGVIDKPSSCGINPNN